MRRSQAGGELLSPSHGGSPWGGAPAPDRSPCPALAFSDGERFQGIAGGVALASIAQLALETDWPGWAGWYALDGLFALALTAELFVRAAYRGLSFWQGKERWWAVFDTALVVCGNCHSWLWPLVCRANGLSERGPVSLLLKVSRLGRILRIFRLFPKLSAFLQALIGMGSTFVYIFGVIFLFCLLSAIICAQLFAHGGVMVGDADTAEDIDGGIRKHFGSVSISLFSLFQVTTQDNWTKIALPAITLLPEMKLFFVTFIILCSWTMISTLTAVASDSMIEATTDRKQVELRAQMKNHEAFLKLLRDCFTLGDLDGNGALDRAEFDALWQLPHVVRGLKELGREMATADVRSAWEMLDFKNTGRLTHDTFVEGIAYLKDTLNTKHILNVNGKVKRTGAQLDRNLQRLFEELECIREQNREMMWLLGEQRNFAEERVRYLDVWERWAQSYDAKALARARSDAGSIARSRVVPPESTPEAMHPFRTSTASLSLSTV